MLNSTEQKIVLKVKSYHPYYINLFVVRLSDELKKAFVSEITQTFLPKKYERITLLKSPHVDKKAREQFERVTHKRLVSIIIKKSSLSVNQTEDLEKIFKLAQTLVVGVEVDLQLLVKNQY